MKKRKPGPPRTPTAVLELRGSPLAKARAKDPEPTPAPCKQLRPPSFLTREGKAVLRIQEQALRESGRLRPEMGPLLVVWVEAWLCYRRAEKAVEDLGGIEVFEMSNKSLCPMPQLKLRHEAFTRLVKISEKMQLFPDPAPAVKKAEPKAEPEEANGKSRFFGKKFGNDRV